jgi:hypothetical protein
VIDNLSERELEQWLRHAMKDSGFCGRELLGFNYDVDWKTEQRVNVGLGGLRDEDPYREMLQRIQGTEDGSKMFLLLGPRGCLKSTGLASDCFRHIFNDPETSVLYASGSDEQVDDKSTAIRNCFEFNDTVHRALGVENGKALRGNPWRKKAWTLSLRKDKSNSNPTFKTGTLKRFPTGGHYNRIYVDDLIDWRNCSSPDALEKARIIMKLIPPLRLPGARVIVAGTRYHPLDLYSHIETLNGWDKMVIGCGFEIEKRADGTYRLHGKPTFPHLSLEYLQEQIDTMEFVDFCAQYQNKHITNFMQLFHREWFKPVRWEDWMKHELTTWILVDVATSTKQTACLSVVFVVGLDRNRRIYLLDAEAGRMEGTQLLEAVFSFHEVWSRKTNMGGVTMENVTANQMLMGFLKEEERKRGVRLNLRTVHRAGAVRQKDKRISNLEPTARAGNIHVVVDTFPRDYVDEGKKKILYDQQGFLDTNTGERLPGGELVDQFVMHPLMPPERKDMADCLADIEQSVGRNGEMLCYWRKPAVAFSHTPSSRPLDARPAGQFDWLRKMVNRTGKR